MNARSSVKFARRARMMMLCFSLCTVIGSTVACSRKSTEPAGPGRDQRAVAITTELVTVRDVPLDLHVVGRVEASATVHVSAQVTGELKKVHFKEGDLVKAGDVLFTLDPRTHQVALSEAQAKVAQTEAITTNAKAELTRNEELAKRSLISQEALERSRTQVSTKEAELRAARGSLEAASLGLTFATIRAPITGRTGSLQVHAGNLVRANDARALVVIRQAQPVRILFAVPEAHIPKIRERMKVTALPVLAIARGQSGPPTQGSVLLMENSVDVATGTIGLVAEFANQDEALWPGQFVDVTLRLEIEPGVIVLPRKAVQETRTGSRVFVVDPQQVAQPREITVRRWEQDLAVLERGVSVGETVVVDGAHLLAPGAKVSTKSPAPAGSRP